MGDHNPEPSERTALLSAQSVTPNDGLAPGAPPTEPRSETSTYDTTSADISASTEITYEQVRARLPWIFPAIAIGVFLSAADQTIIVSSYGLIGSDLHALSSTSWIATAYFLTLTSFQPLYGKLSDIFGRKPCLLFAYLVFGTGCLLCGLARDIRELIGARALAGIGGGGMTTVVSIILSDTVSLRDRGTWQGYVNIIYAAGASTGAPLGGLLADTIGWRWAFLIQSPLCLLAFVSVGLTMHLPPLPSTQPWRTKLRRIDFLGAGLLIAGITTLLVALDRGSNISWSDTITLVSLCASLPLFALFLLVETRWATEPFAPGHIILDRSLLAAFLCNFFSFAGYLAALFYIPLYFQASRGMSATQAGLRLIPATVAGVSGSLFAGLYMQRTGRFYVLTVACYAGLTAGAALILLFAGLVVDSDVGVIAGMCLGGFSNGIGVTSTLIGLIANAHRDDQAVATACSYLFRSLGSVFGVSLSATVVNEALRDGLRRGLQGDAERAAEIARGVRESLGFIDGLDEGTRVVVRTVYAASTRAAFGLQIGLVSGAAIAAWFIKEKPLSR